MGLLLCAHEPSVRSVPFTLRWDGWCCSEYVGLSRSTKGSGLFGSEDLSSTLVGEESAPASEGVPVTMSASQSPRPLGAASRAVCGL